MQRCSDLQAVAPNADSLSVRSLPQRGQGTRDITRNVLAGFYARRIFRPGDPLEIRGQRGVLKAITATQTLIEQDTGLVVVANSAFLDDTIRH